VFKAADHPIRYPHTGVMPGLATDQPELILKPKYKIQAVYFFLKDFHLAAM
jgi:hypothetical protein